jgi:hypothetical protein
MVEASTRGSKIVDDGRAEAPETPSGAFAHSYAKYSHGRSRIVGEGWTTKARPAFGGRNGAVAFSQTTLTGDSVEPPVQHTRLVTRHVFGTRDRILVDCQLTGGAPSGGNCTGTSYRSPSYSRDGERLVFDAGERIGVMAADGSGLSLLPAATSDDGNPAFAPDGRRIAFTGTNARGTTDLYVRRLDGGAAQLIVNDAGEPTWSARDVIAYVRSGNIYVARSAAATAASSPPESRRTGRPTVAGSCSSARWPRSPSMPR